MHYGGQRLEFHRYQVRGETYVVGVVEDALAGALDEVVQVRQVVEELLPHDEGLSREPIVLRRAVRLERRQRDLVVAEVLLKVGREVIDLLQ